MEKKLSAAVIGCGRMGAFTGELIAKNAPACWFPLSHADAISSHPRLRLEALCDVDAQSLQRAAKKFSVERCYEKPIDLFNREKPTLLGLATRTLGRADLIRMAFDSGTKAIHAEKPLCNSVSELQALQKVFDANDDLFITWGAIRRFFDVYRQAVSLAKSGMYGQLREIRVNLGSAPLYWTHPHSLDLLLFAASGEKVLGVQAHLNNVVNEGSRTRISSDPQVMCASVYFESGLIGHITQALGSDFVLSCENAEITVRADGGKLDVYCVSEGIYPSFQSQEIIQGSSPTGSLGPISHLVECLEGQADSIELNKKIKRDILNAQSISFAMLQSHLEGSRIVDLSATDPSIAILARSGGRYA